MKKMTLFAACLMALLLFATLAAAQTKITGGKLTGGKLGPAGGGSGQGIVLDGSTQLGTRALANSAPYNAMADWRVTGRVRGFPLNHGSHQVILTTWEYDIYIPSNTETLVLRAWANSATVTVSIAGRSDIAFKARRISATGEASLEVWNADGSNRAVSTSASFPTGSQAWGGHNMAVGGWGVGDRNLQGKIDFLRVYSTAGTLDAGAPVVGDAAGDVLSYEFEGNGNDSASGAQHLTLLGSPTFEGTP